MSRRAPAAHPSHPFGACRARHVCVQVVLVEIDVRHALGDPGQARGLGHVAARRGQRFEDAFALGEIRARRERRMGIVSASMSASPQDSAILPLQATERGPYGCIVDGDLQAVGHGRLPLNLGRDRMWQREGSASGVRLLMWVRLPPPRFFPGSSPNSERGARSRPSVPPCGFPPSPPDSIGHAVGPAAPPPAQLQSACFSSRASAAIASRYRSMYAARSPSNCSGSPTKMSTKNGTIIHSPFGSALPSPYV